MNLDHLQKTCPRCAAFREQKAKIERLATEINPEALLGELGVDLGTPGGERTVVRVYPSPLRLSDEQIRPLAYIIWKRTGNPDAEANWFKAVDLLEGIMRVVRRDSYYIKSI
jgi:hypothetical protein